MPLGNLTSQFFANVYLHELDFYVKHVLKAKYYIRYVDDFVLMHRSKEQLECWKELINRFLSEQLKLTLHPNKSRIIPLSEGIDFVGFRNFYKYLLLRKRNIRNMERKIHHYREGRIDFSSLVDSYHGWQAYARWGNTHTLRKRIRNKIASVLWDKTE
ncbi:MAG: RNA-directed DNA polymerase [Nanoarchaeota archaeon]